MGRSGALTLLLALIAAPAAAAPFTVTEVAPGIYVRQGVYEDATRANDDAIANIGFIVGGNAVAVIDPGGSQGDGERLRETIAAKTRLPVRYVIMTHAHPDHVFGGAAFVGDHPVFVGHERLPGALAERGSFYRDQLKETLGADRAGDFVVPTLLVHQQEQIDLGDRILDLDAHAAAHTDNDITVFDRNTKTLWAGDLLFVERVPALDGNLLGWLKELAALEAKPAARAVPGHGPPSVPWPTGAADEQRYLETLARDTRAILKKNGDIETAIATVAASERGRWKLFDDYNGRNATEAFKELEWEDSP